MCLLAGWLAGLLAGPLALTCTRNNNRLAFSKPRQLSENALRALEIGAGLKTGKLQRHTFRFSKSPALLAAANAPLFSQSDEEEAGEGDWMPFLTLRSPLKAGEVRRMNLFEPRWLAMLDGISAASTRRRSGSGDATTISTSTSTSTSSSSSGLLGATFGTVHAVNRCYVRCYEQGGSAEESGEPAEVEADVVVDPRAARLAVVERVEEGVRPVSGDRRLAVWIRGLDPLVAPPPPEGSKAEAKAKPEARSEPKSVAKSEAEAETEVAGGEHGRRSVEAPVALRPTPGGFLAGECRVAASATTDNGDDLAARGSDDGSGSGDGGLGDGAEETVSVVCVVGLVHANPILRRCAERGLRSAAERGELDGEVARAIRERELAGRLADLPWGEYDREFAKGKYESL